MMAVVLGLDLQKISYAMSPTSVSTLQKVTMERPPMSKSWDVRQIIAT